MDAPSPSCTSSLKLGNITDNLTEFLTEIVKKSWKQEKLDEPGLAELGETFFSNIVVDVPHLQALDDFSKVLTASETYIFVRQHLRNWMVQGKYGKYSLKQFMIQSFVYYISTSWKTTDDFKVYYADYRSNSKLLPVLPILVTYNFPEKVRFWEHVGLDRLDAQVHHDFITVVRKMANRGVASMEVIGHCLRREYLKPHLPKGYRLLCQALLMGKISLPVINDMFASKSVDEIRSGRMAFFCVEKMAESYGNYQRAIWGFFHDVHPSRESYELFKENFEDLMSQLKYETPHDNRLDLERMQVLISQAATRYFKKSSICKNLLADLFCQAIADHPSIRGFIADILKANGEAEEQIAFWRDLNPFKIHMRDLLILWPDVRSVYDAPSAVNALTIPSLVEVVTVSGDTGLNRIEQIFRQLAQSPHPSFVGIDTEWSMYCHTTKANLLQISTTSVIFLIDLDAFDDSHLTRCYDLIFGPKYEIYKIGYQYQEDLIQLRRTAPLVKSLYEPSGVVCISRLLSSLCAFNKPFLYLKTFFRGLPLKPDPDHCDAEFSEKSLRMMGLSKLTEMLLGCRLEKSEQQSLWNRRPLSVSQKRYAALDAYVLAVFGYKLVQFCSLFHIDLTKLARQLSEPKTPPPFMLFSEFDPFVHPTITLLDVFPIEYQQ